MRNDRQPQVASRIQIKSKAALRKTPTPKLQRLSPSKSVMRLKMYPRYVSSSRNAAKIHEIASQTTRFGILPGRDANWLKSSGVPVTRYRKGTRSKIENA